MIMTKFVKEKLKSLKHLSSANRIAEADSDTLTLAKLALFLLFPTHWKVF